MTICVYGKNGCGLCEAAKDKLNRMGLPFESRELSALTEFHAGWRTDDSVEIMACYADIATLPVVTIDGVAMGYPEAMKHLKRNKQSTRAAVGQDAALATQPQLGALTAAV